MPGLTVESTGGAVLAAAFCIDRGHTLLHADREFDAFQAARGLRAWRH